MAADGQPMLVGTNIVISGSARVDPTCRIGHCSFIGYEPADVDRDEPDPPTVVGARTVIGCYCVIEAGASLAPDVRVDHYVRVGRRTTVGPGTRLL